jgi:hypothetical protein
MTNPTIEQHTDVKDVVGRHDVLIRQLQGRSVALDPWHVVGAAGEPAFQNGWANYGAGEQTLAFRKDPFGRVYMRGIVKGGANATVIFTLPTGYRPPLGANCSIPTASGSNTGIASVAANGNVVLSLNVTAPLASYMDGVEFDTDSVTQALAGPPGAPGPPGPIGVVQDEGVALAQRSALNFVGAGVTAADDSANNRTNVAVNADVTTAALNTALLGKIGAVLSGVRLVMGNVAANGAINFGNGFTISNYTTGGYVITFTPQFTSTPVLVGTCYAGPSGIGVLSIEGSAIYNAQQVVVRTINNVNYLNLPFTFLAFSN